MKAAEDRIDPSEAPEVIRRLLEGRGVPADALEAFFNATCADLLPPEALPGVSEAATAIESFVASHRKIVVFGDYDCDGVAATAILVKTLTALGADVVPFIPRRRTEGYGMSDAAVARMRSEYPDAALVVTVDNGINSVRQVAELKEHGIDVVVTDHHLPGEELPAARALVATKVSAPAALDGLCGAAIACRLAQHMIVRARSARRDRTFCARLGGELYVLAALATVTDVMPLVGENRILVSEALAHFRAWAPLGLRELLDRAAKSGAMRMTSKDFGYLLGPRINAAGRLHDAMSALELILTDDREIARESARIVDGYNVERKSIEQEMTDEALKKVVPGAAAQMIDLPDGNPGVAGIVAARLLGSDVCGNVPICVQADGHGSARAPEGLNIRDAFEACSDCLVSYGGHAAAGGFVVKPGMTDLFRDKLCAWCAAQAAVSPAAPRATAEAWLKFDEITLDLAEWVMRLEPFGEGNRPPVFGLRGVHFSEVRPIGADGRHLSLTLIEGGLKAVRWNAGAEIETLRREAYLSHDILFTVEISEYGERHVELRIEDCRLST